MIVVEGEFQSQPFLTILYTNGERLEGLGCCELLESVSRHTIWVQKVSMGQAEFVPSQSWKIGCGDHISVIIYQSQPCLTIHCTYEERLEGLKCCEIAESVYTRSMLV